MKSMRAIHIYGQEMCVFLAYMQVPVTLAAVGVPVIGLGTGLGTGLEEQFTNLR